MRPDAPRRTHHGRSLSAAGMAMAFVVAWLISRTAMGLLWSARETFIDRDVRYYHWQLVNNGLTGALVEYPTPIPLVLEALRLVFGSTENSYVVGFAVVMALIDGAASVWLWRTYSRRAAVYWALFTFAIGSLVWFRIDLLPAVAVLAGLVWLTRRPLASGIAVALGAATKLWPALLIVPMLTGDRAARRRTTGFVALGGALGLGSVVAFGWQRSVSPLTWQSDRGLQVESIVATWPMIRNAFGPSGEYYTDFSQHNAWEVYGPAVEAWLGVADVLMAGTIILALALGWLIALNGVGLPGRRLSGPQDPDASARRTHAILLSQLAIICAMIVANKTFSPQYMIWLAGPLAVLSALPSTRRQRMAGHALEGLGLVCAGLTHLVYPLNYAGLIAAEAQGRATLLLVTRNLLMVVLATIAIVLAVTSAVGVGRPDASLRAP